MKSAVSATLLDTGKIFSDILFGMGAVWRLVWCVAIYRLEAKIISRGKGHSAVAAAAYRTGTKIRDERADKIHDYSSRTKGVVETVILRPDNSPEWTANTATLWNAVELGEKRKDAQLSREFILALPRELSAKEQWECAVGWAQSELVNKGMIAEVSLHNPKSGKNPHCHILCTMRTIEGDTFSAKKPREWNDKALLVHWRESWCKAENDSLEKAGRPERVDHRSLVAQGIDRVPQPKLGKEAVGMKKRGVLHDPERFKAVREVKLFNEVLSMMKSIRTHGSVTPSEAGPQWWKSVGFLSRARERAQTAIKNTWQKVVQSRWHKKEKDGPEPAI